MPYTFKLYIKKEKSRLVLLNGNEEVAGREWSEGHDMGRQLFAAIAELLRENSLTPERIGEFVVDTQVPEHATSVRIAETVQRMYTFGVRVKNKNFAS